MKPGCATKSCGTLFDTPATARRNDPVQSHMAADRKNRSQTLGPDRLAVLEAVSEHPGFTAKQLDVFLNQKAHRRAKELADMGLITRDETGPEMTMFITEKGKRQIEIVRN